MRLDGLGFLSMQRAESLHELYSYLLELDASEVLAASQDLQHPDRLYPPDKLTIIEYFRTSSPNGT